MSHGWCRLNLRQEVLEVDALMSAMLYEEMLASRNGKLRRWSVRVCVWRANVHVHLATILLV